MINTFEELLILGITPENRPFRPSDWTERICGVIASHDKNGRWVYSEYAHPIIHEGRAGVRIKTTLEKIDPNTYQFIINFARDNRLRIIPAGKMTSMPDIIPSAVNTENFEDSDASEEIASSLKKVMTTVVALHWKTKLPFRNSCFF